MLAEFLNLFTGPKVHNQADVLHWSQRAAQRQLVGIGRPFRLPASVAVIYHSLFARALGNHAPWNQPAGLANDVGQEFCASGWGRAEPGGRILQGLPAKTRRT